MTLYSRLKETSKKRGLSLQDVATKAGLGVNSLYKWDKQDPTAPTLQAVADVLHVSVDYLLGNTDNPSQPKKVGNHREVDLADDTLILSFDGKEVSPEDRELILRLMRGKKDGK